MGWYTFLIEGSVALCAVVAFSAVFGAVLAGLGWLVRIDEGKRLK